MKRTIGLAGIVAAVLAVGCRDGVGPAPGSPDDDERGAPVTATITEAGGSLRAITQDGAVLTFHFPEGAVGEALELTLSPRPPEARAWARLEVSPTGIQLNKPVQISLTAPEGRTIEGSGFYFGSTGNAVLLPTRLDASTRTLSTSTQLLGYAATDVSTGNLRTLSTGSTGSGFLNVGEITCALALTSMRERLEYARTFSFSSSQSAHALVSEIEAAMELCAGNPDDTSALAMSIEELKPRTCDGYRDASAGAAAIFIEDAETLQMLIVPVLGWEATKRVVGTDCGVAASDFIELIDDKYGQFIDSYTARINSPGFGDGVYRTMWGEFASVFDVLTDTHLLSLEAAEAKTREVLLPALLDRLRDVGYRACREDDTQQYLAALLSGGRVIDNPIVPNPIAYARFSAEELEHDVQYCASKLTVTGFDGVEPLGSRELHGGAEPGAHVTEAALMVPLEESVLVLQGDVHAFTCLLPGQAVTLGSDELVIKVDGEEVRRLQHSGGRFFSTALELHVEEILEQAGLDPETVEGFALTIFREGPACEGHYGDQSFELFSVAVEVGGESALEIRAMGELSAHFSGRVAVVQIGSLDTLHWQSGPHVRDDTITTGTHHAEVTTGNLTYEHPTSHGVRAVVSGRTESALTHSIDRTGDMIVIHFAGSASAHGEVAITGTEGVPPGVPMTVHAAAGAVGSSFSRIELVLRRPMLYAISVASSQDRYAVRVLVPDDSPGHGGWATWAHWLDGATGRLETGSYQLRASTFVTINPLPGGSGRVVWGNTDPFSNKTSASDSPSRNVQYTLTLVPAPPAEGAPGH